MAAAGYAAIGSPPVADTTGPTVTVTFSEAVDTGTVTTATFTVSDGGAVTGDITVAVDGLSATLNPSVDLANSTTYTVTVTSGVTDTSDNALDQDGDPDNGNQDFTSSFTTAAVPGSAPVVDACTPDNANPGDQLVVAVTGSNFQDGATVDFGERVMVQNVTFVSDTQLDVKIKVHPKATSGSHDVTVTNPDVQSGIKAGCFAVN